MIDYYKIDGQSVIYNFATLRACAEIDREFILSSINPPTVVIQFDTPISIVHQDEVDRLGIDIARGLFLHRQGPGYVDIGTLSFHIFFNNDRDGAENLFTLISDWVIASLGDLGFNNIEILGNLYRINRKIIGAFICSRDQYGFYLAAGSVYITRDNATALAVTDNIFDVANSFRGLNDMVDPASEITVNQVRAAMENNFKNVFKDDLNETTIGLDDRIDELVDIYSSDQWIQNGEHE